MNSIFVADALATKGPGINNRGHLESIRKCYFDEIFLSGCTGSCHFDNFQCSQWWRFHQNDNIFVTVVFAQFSRNNWVWVPEVNIISLFVLDKSSSTVIEFFIDKNMKKIYVFQENNLDMNFFCCCWIILNPNRSYLSHTLCTDVHNIAVDVRLPPWQPLAQSVHLTAWKRFPHNWELVGEPQVTGGQSSPDSHTKS